MCWQNIFQAKFPRILFSIDCRLQQARLVSVSQCVNTVSNCWMISEAEANMVWAEIRQAGSLGESEIKKLLTPALLCLKDRVKGP